MICKKVVSDIQFNLTLTLDEALWLKAAFQNPLGGEEAPDDRVRRVAVWQALNDAGVYL